jgi:hypothetical protein
MLKRLSSSMRFSYGARAGALKTAAKRSGSAFRVDVRQRVIVKALVSRHMGKGAARGAALAAHIRYLGREGAGHEGEAGTFFDRQADVVDGAERTRGWAEHRHHFRFIVSPEHGDRIADLQDYVRDVMGRVCADLGEPELPWMAVCHFDTDQPHAHVLMPGRRADGAHESKSHPFCHGGEILWMGSASAVLRCPQGVRVIYGRDGLVTELTTDIPAA